MSQQEVVKEIPKELREKIEKVKRAIGTLGKLKYGDHVIIGIEIRQSTKKPIVVLKTEDGGEITMYPAGFLRAQFRVV